MKINKKHILSFSCCLVLAALIIPKIASSAIYFITKPDGNYARENKDKPCPIRGYKLLNCNGQEPKTPDPDSYCFINEVKQNYFKRCLCDTTTYNIDPTGCSYIDDRNFNQVVKGLACDGKYSRCGCPDDASYFVRADGSNNCPNKKVPVGSACTADGTAYYQSCVCPDAYNRLCAYPYVADSAGECEGKSQRCVCDPGIYNKTCDTHGGKAKYGCADPDTGQMKYSTCNDELPQTRIFVVDGSFPAPLATSCGATTQSGGLPDARITFTKSGQSDVVAITDGNGVASIAIPFEVDDETVTVRIEKSTEENYESDDNRNLNFVTLTDTCPCDGKVYALNPKKLGDNVDEIRIITTWGTTAWSNTANDRFNIRDLDTHLLRSDNTYLYYGNRSSKPGGMSLDVDDVSCFGPETMSFPRSQVTGGNGYSASDFFYSSIIFSTSDLQNDTLKGSQTTTYLYVDGELKRIFKVGKASQIDPRGTVWNTFKLSNNSGTVKIEGSGGTHGKIRDIGTGTGTLTSSDYNSKRAGHGW